MPVEQAAADALMDQPTASQFLRRGRVDFGALASTCDPPPYAVRFEGARSRTTAEVQAAAAQKLAPKLASKLSAIGKAAQASGATTSPTPPATTPVTPGAGAPAATPAPTIDPNAPLSAELDGALERGKVSVSDAEAIYDVSHAYFCALRTLYPSYSDKLNDAEANFRGAVDVIFDPDLYENTPEARTLKQTKISAAKDSAKNWPKLANSDSTIKRALPDAHYDGGFKGDVLFKVTLVQAVDLTTCAGAAFASDAVIDQNILATLNQLRDLVAQSIAGQGNLAVGRLALGANTTMSAHQANPPTLTIRDLVCLDSLMHGTTPPSPPAPIPPGTNGPSISPSPTPVAPPPAPVHS
jgi:hypothetical protein